jgi:FAD/FMN-containing dehydrogenase
MTVSSAELSWTTGSTLERTSGKNAGSRWESSTARRKRSGWRRRLASCPTTGIAGLTLGGGLGWLNGRDGLACDNLISADVATADGQVLRASPEENDDLFWGIRGGGGNFGIVTSFEYQLHPVDLVLAGRRFHEVEMPPR